MFEKEYTLYIKDVSFTSKKVILTTIKSLNLEVEMSFLKFDKIFRHEKFVKKNIFLQRKNNKASGKS